jgi:phosphoglycolate phosphatase
VKASGARQSIISALRQDLLEEITARLGVAKYMDRICGVDNLDGFGKVGRAREMLSSICASSPFPPPSSFVLVGDALHDKEVADALGVRCVLCAQGSHAAWRLRAVAPTGDTLLGAVRMALGQGGA